MVELSGGLVVPRAPALSAIDGNGRALIAPCNHALRIGRIDPQSVIIVPARRSFDCLPIFAAVGGAIKGDVGQIHDIGVLWIDGDFAEVPETPEDARVGPDSGPRCSAVIGTIEPGLFGLFVVDQSIETFAGGAAGDANADPAPVPCRQAGAAELCPCVSL